MKHLRNIHRLSVSGLALIWLLAGLAGAVVAADISVTSTFTPTGTAGRCDNNNGVDVPGVGCFSNPDGVMRNWADANNYCNGLGGGKYLPPRHLLEQLYDAYPLNQMATTWGWPTMQGNYWTSTPAGTDYYSIIDLGDGTQGSHNGNNNVNHVTCLF